MKTFAPAVTVLEVTYEALPQLALQVPSPHLTSLSPPSLPLQVYIVLRSPHVTPSWTQLASIGSSFLTATLGPAEDFLTIYQGLLREQDRSNKHYARMTLGEKLPLIGNARVIKSSVMR